MKNSTYKDRPKDDKAPDGIFSYGVRRVREGGMVYAVGLAWQDDRLLEYEGSYVWVSVDGYWIDSVSIAFPNLTDYLFKIHHKSARKRLGKIKFERGSKSV